MVNTKPETYYHNCENYYRLIGKYKTIVSTHTNQTKDDWKYADQTNVYKCDYCGRIKTTMES